MCLEKKSLEFIRKSSTRKLLIEKFVTPIGCKSTKVPLTIFMAGSPGAGKTEFSERLIKKLRKPIVRIDADEIRKVIPGYVGSNSYEVQSAACIGVEKIYDYVMHNGFEAVVDGTFASYEVAKRNIQRALDKFRVVAIFYVYQEPELAWKFTQAREAYEGRRITKETFVDALFGAKDNVNKMKEEFGNKVIVFYIEKDFQNRTKRAEIDIDSVDNYVNLSYDKGTLMSLL